MAPNQDLAIAVNNLGALYRHLKRPDEALPLLEEAAAMFEALHGATHASVAGVLDNLADLHADGGEVAVALPLQLRSLGILRQVHGDGHHETVGAFFRTARLQVLAGEVDAALANCELALPATLALERGGGVRVLNFANEVALALANSPSAAHSAAIARATVAQVDDLAATDPATRARFRTDLAECLRRAGDGEGAAGECAAVRELLDGEGVGDAVKERLRQRLAGLGL